MLVILKRDGEEISLQAAQLIAGAVRKKPALVLGLATGGTMVGVYRHLVGLHKQGSLDFSRVVTVNLDEYLGLPAATSTFPTAPSAAITISTAHHTKTPSELPEESISNFWASAATATLASTSPLPASPPARA